MDCRGQIVIAENFASRVRADEPGETCSDSSVEVLQLSGATARGPQFVLRGAKSGEVDCGLGMGTRGCGRSESDLRTSALGGETACRRLKMNCSIVGEADCGRGARGGGGLDLRVLGLTFFESHIRFSAVPGNLELTVEVLKIGEADLG